MDRLAITSSNLDTSTTLQGFESMPMLNQDKVAFKALLKQNTPKSEVKAPPEPTDRQADAPQELEQEEVAADGELSPVRKKAKVDSEAEDIEPSLAYLFGHSELRSEDVHFVPAQSITIDALANSSDEHDLIFTEDLIKAPSNDNDNDNDNEPELTPLPVQVTGMETALGEAFAQVLHVTSPEAVPEDAPSLMTPAQAEAVTELLAPSLDEDLETFELVHPDSQPDRAPQVQTPSIATPSQTTTTIPATVTAPAPQPESTLIRELPPPKFSHEEGLEDTSELSFAQASNPLEAKQSNLATNNTKVAELHIPSPLALDAWQGQLNQQMMHMVADDIQQARIALNPPNLGPLEIQLTLDREKATILFTSPHQAVLQTVKAGEVSLSEALAQEGLQLNMQLAQEQNARQELHYQHEEQARLQAKAANTRKPQEVQKPSPGTGSQDGAINYYV